MNILRKIREVDKALNEGLITYQEAADAVAPFTDAEPIKHGYWIDVNGDGSLWRCSVCGETQCCNSNYCGDCGAKMGEVKE